MADGGSPHPAWATQTSLEKVARARLKGECVGLLALAIGCEPARVLAIFHNGTCQREERVEIARLLDIPEEMVKTLISITEPRQGASSR